MAAGPVRSVVGVAPLDRPAAHDADAVDGGRVHGAHGDGGRICYRGLNVTYTSYMRPVRQRPVCSRPDPAVRTYVLTYSTVSSVNVQLSEEGLTLHRHDSTITQLLKTGIIYYTKYTYSWNERN